MGRPREILQKISSWGANILIFVSVGTHTQQFNRLLKEIDKLKEQTVLKEKIFAQTGFSKYKPKNFQYKKFISPKEFNILIKKADLFITHGGAGSIGAALQLNKKIIIVPRLKKFYEHTNDHQLELAKKLEEEGKAIAVLRINDLKDAIKKIKFFNPKREEKGGKIIKLIEGFLSEKMA
ncbi:MAG: PssE/Cps14G family polysaccharide biosynthesis glycosyltransferase [Candidatus Diapherotrites archaeon]